MSNVRNLKEITGKVTRSTGEQRAPGSERKKNIQHIRVVTVHTCQDNKCNVWSF
jgi:hypothetical protein